MEQTAAEHLRHTQRGKKASAKAARASSGEPKRPVNVYMLFAGAHRAAVKEENPSLTLGELGKPAGLVEYPVWLSWQHHVCPVGLP